VTRLIKGLSAPEAGDSARKSAEPLSSPGFLLLCSMPLEQLTSLKGLSAREAGDSARGSPEPP